MHAATQSQQTPPPGEAPAAPVSITTAVPDGKTLTLQIPRTETELRALRAHRDELSSQLSSVASRRRAISEEIRAAFPGGASQQGLEARLRLLDQRILQLETDITATGRQLSAAPAELLASTAPPPSGGDDWAEGMAFGGFFALVGVALVTAFRRFRRRRTRAVPANLLPESAQRLERVEHAVEAIAVEVERIGEGQRFVTRLLSESQAPLVGAHRIAQPAAVAHDDPAKR